MTQDKKPRQDKYWICGDCADSRKWTRTDSNITVIKGLCGHCKREDRVTLIPVVDFNTPKGSVPIWD